MAFLPDRMLPKENGKLQSTHIEFHCKILDMNFRCAYMTQATFGSFAEWAIVSSAPLFVSGWSAYKHAISTNTTKWHPQTTTETLSYNRKVTSCKEAYCIPTAKAMRDIKQWHDSLQQTLTLRFHLNTFKSSWQVIWIQFIWQRFKPQLLIWVIAANILFTLLVSQNASVFPSFWVILNSTWLIQTNLYIASAQLKIFIYQCIMSIYH